jgi:hypothetical protein
MMRFKGTGNAVKGTDNAVKRVPIMRFKGTGNAVKGTGNAVKRVPIMRFKGTGNAVKRVPIMTVLQHAGRRGLRWCVVLPHVNLRHCAQLAIDSSKLSPTMRASLVLDLLISTSQPVSQRGLSSPGHI